MRRISTSALLVLLLLVAGCGSEGSKAKALTPVEKVRAAASATYTTSSRFELLTTSKAEGQDFEMKGTGIFDYSGKSPRGDMTMTFGPVTIKQRMLDGDMYLQIPGDTSWHRIALKDLVGTSLSESSNPAASADLVAAMGDDVKEVGTETIRGTKTTHYTGTIGVAKAKELAKGDVAKKQVQKLIDGGVTTIPSEVFLDDQGRLRRLIQDISMTFQGQKAQVKTQVDIYEFGVKVDVQKPPASEIKDGAELLKSIKGQLG